MNKVILILILAYIVLSGVLRISGSGSLDSASDRIVIADILSLFLILISFFYIFKKNEIYFPDVYKFYLPLLVVFLVSGVVSEYPDRAIIEILATLIGFIVSIALINLLINSDLHKIENFFNSYIFVIGGLFSFFVVDFLFLNLINRPIGGLTGTFRNTGQAGAFIGVHLSLLIPLLLSGLLKKNIINYYFIFISILALVLTFKRAALFGFSIGVFLLLILLAISNNKNDKKIFIVLSIFVTILGFLGLSIFNWGLDNVEGMMGRWDSKFSSDTVSDFQEGFLAENIKFTLQAFYDSPLLGLGLGNVEMTDFGHEIHSTYMSILATSGLLGVTTYICFIFIYTRVLLQNIFSNNKNKYQMFFYYYFPFYIGLLASWGYTYHLRKREFWFMIAFVLLISYLAKHKKVIQSSTN